MSLIQSTNSLGKSKIPGVAFGETVLSNIVAILMKISHKELTSQLEEQLLEGYNNGCQEKVVIKYGKQ